MKYKRGNEEKTLRLQNDSKDFTVTSVLNEFPIVSFQQASDCFGKGGFINQFRQVCGFKAQSYVSVKTSNTGYSSIGSLSSAEVDTADPTSHYDHSHHISTDSEKDKIVCDISVKADKTRLFQAK